MSEEPKQLEPYYYVNHWRDMCAYVRKHYDKLFDQDTRQRFYIFYKLSLPARALFLRLAGRKYIYVKLKSISYTDIINPIDELVAKNFLCFLNEHVITAALSILTINELNPKIIKPYLNSR